INVMNNMSVDCDCSSHPADPVVKDLGIVASLDPVAMDQACVDMVMNLTPEEGSDNGPLVERITTRHGTHTIDYAEKIGMGSKTYELIMIDEE
ncbi:MAG: ferredoxin, partial [Rikenellaceae bacterium]|nr:ferredoxin [Rikenellaceae bacterium]